jgi:iron(III)-salmochelin esterase
MFGYGAVACQSATTGARAEALKNGMELTPAVSVDVGSSLNAKREDTPSESKPLVKRIPHASKTAPHANTPYTSASEAPPLRVPSPVVQVPLRLHELTIESDAFGELPVLVRVPAHLPNERLPVLFVLHGRGEAAKGPERGVRAFLDDYRLERVWKWLELGARGPLPDASITTDYQNEVQRQLEQRPFSGMVLVMPYLPDRFRAAEAFDNGGAYAAVLRQTAQQLHATFPVANDVSRWGLDGISLGGRVALICGPQLTDVFGAIGGVQAAIDEREFAALLNPMRPREGGRLPRYSLATSAQDYYRSVLEAFHQDLKRNQLPHSFTILPGDHSYSFNRGPGLAYLLLTYDALLHP